MLMPDAIIARRSCRILIVEDNSGDTYLLNRALLAASRNAGIGLELAHSENGLQALGAVARGDLTARLPDIVVVDLKMPIMGGELFLRRLRGDLGLPKLPAVVLTTSNEKFMHMTALSSGANHVFVKPNSFAELLVIASKVLECATEGGLSTN
jgi:CheY-like chemotaxis protein